MRQTEVEFRGKDVRVSYKDYGYESDTNAHVIEWDFVDFKPNPPATDKEMEDIDRQLYDYIYERY